MPGPEDTHATRAALPTVLTNGSQELQSLWDDAASTSPSPHRLVPRNLEARLVPGPKLQLPKTLPSLAAREEEEEEAREPICTVVGPQRDALPDGPPSSLASPPCPSAGTGDEATAAEAQPQGPGAPLAEEEGTAAQPRASRAFGLQQEVADGPAGRQEEVRRGCFRTHQVHVRELQTDGTLGLLLHGTSIVGFRTKMAREAGWAVSDQIVEVNARPVSTFDEFLENFAFAQAEGFPIIFSVLRREDPSRDEAEAEVRGEDALDEFFSTVDFTNLAGELQRRWGSRPPPRAARGEEEEEQQAAMFTAHGLGGGCGGDDGDNLANNPYVLALNRRREEQRQSNEGWMSCSAEEADGSLPSRLATRREGVAMLQGAGGQAGSVRMQHSDSSCAWPFCIPGDRVAPGASACETETMVHELQPTPRADFYEAPVLLDTWRVLGCDGGDPLLGGQAPPESFQQRCISRQAVVAPLVAGPAAAEARRAAISPRRRPLS